MKKNLLKTLVVIIPVSIIGVIGYLFFSFQQKKEKIKLLETIPQFYFKTIDGRTFTTENVNDSVKILVYFSPECHFCQAEAEELYENMDKYNKIQWIWVASEPISEIKQFAEKYHLDKKENIHWCYDEKASFYRGFKMKSVPYFLVYDKNNRLIKRNSGAIKLKKLLDETHKEN